MRGNSKANLFIAIIFFLSIYLPVIWMAFPNLNISPKIEEKRKLAKWPTFNLDSVSSYPKQFERFFDDHFGFRNSLIYLNNLIRLKVFNSSGSPKVLVGKEGWLFLNEENPEKSSVLLNHLGVIPKGFNEILLQLKDELESKNAYLSKLGIRYVVVIAPDKRSIYPEYLPKGYFKFGRKANVDLLMEYLKENSNVDIIYLKENFLKYYKNKESLLYYKSDSHWNNLGAFYAYIEISKYLSRFFPEIKIREASDFDVLGSILSINNDLENILAVENADDIFYRFVPKKEYSYFKTYEDPKNNDLFFINFQKNLPKALVFRDSFMNNVLPFLTENFSEVVYTRSDCNIKNFDTWLKKTRPHIVIEQMVERSLIPKSDY